MTEIHLKVLEKIANTLSGSCGLGEESSLLRNEFWISEIALRVRTTDEEPAILSVYNQLDS